MRLLLIAALALPVLAAASEPLAGTPLLRLPAAEVRAAIEARKGEPLRYAVSQALRFDQRDGAWDTPAAGVARWRLRLASAGARSLELQLGGVVLPEGAELWFTGADGRDRQGPYTATSPALRGGALSLPVVRAEEAVLEVRLPTAAAPQLRLQAVKAYHGFRLLSADTMPDKAAIGEESGTCNINVRCTAGNSWREEIRATVLLSIDGARCSGTLMNNTRQDGRPLILTANHCGIRSGNVQTVTAYFNVESSSCGGNDDGRVDQNLAGASFLARDAQSDFTLFTLASAVPASFNALYAGWDARSDSVPQSGVTIHHPRGDEKKISVFSSPATKVEDAVVSDFIVDAWQLRWSQGTTEQGSSGSALWNQDHRVVGVLSGGNASCAQPNAVDLFGRIERAWTAGCASDNQLKAHLDPAGSNCLTLPSRQGGSAPVSLAGCPIGPADACGGNGGDGGDGEAGSGSPGWPLLAALGLAAISRRAFRASARA